MGQVLGLASLSMGCLSRPQNLLGILSSSSLVSLFVGTSSLFMNAARPLRISSRTALTWRLTANSHLRVDREARGMAMHASVSYVYAIEIMLGKRCFLV